MARVRSSPQFLGGDPIWYDEENSFPSLPDMADIPGEMQGQAAFPEGPQDLNAVPLPRTAPRTPLAATGSSPDGRFLDIPPELQAHAQAGDRDAFAGAFANWLGQLPAEMQENVFAAHDVAHWANNAQNNLENVLWAKTQGWGGNRPVTEPPPQPQSPDYWTPSRVEAARSPIVDEAPLGGGINETIRLSFANGQHGVFKPQSGEDKKVLRFGVPVGSQHRREVAASVIADLLGFGDLVPSTSYREHNGKTGSVQNYVDSKAASLVSSKYDGQTDAARAALFDYIIGHMDRHQNNWMVQNPQANPKLVLIDNGLSFPTYHFERDFSRGREFWKYATGVWNLPMPDTTGMIEAWPRVEAALRDVGIEEPAIALTKRRFLTAVSGNYHKISELPAFFMPEREGMVPNLRQAIWKEQASNFPD